MARLPAILATALLLAGCSTQPPPTGPGTATLTIGGTYSECHSFGGCEYSARLEGSGISAEATFQGAQAPKALAIGAGLPQELRDGSYTLTFTSKLMSDLISNLEPRDFSIDATCATPFVVGAGKSTVAVRVTFTPGRCNIELATTD